MNQRQPSRLSAGARRALHCLSLLLLPALAPEGVQAGPPGGRTAPGERAPEPKPKPYLAALGAPPLRFAEPAPPPDLTTRPAAAAPPNPVLKPTDASVAQENIAAAQSVAEAAAAPAPVPAAIAETKPVFAPNTPTPAKGPAPILPDDNRPPVRAEDFLPFFQIPGSARRPEEVMLIAPVPSAPAVAPIAPSSATYIQSK